MEGFSRLSQEVETRLGIREVGVRKRLALALILAASKREQGAIFDDFLLMVNSPQIRLCTGSTLRLAAVIAAGLAFLPVSLSHVPSGLPSLMTISTPLHPSHPSFIKMEDRKRSAGDDLAPPTKRQAVNGKASADADLPWASDLEVCYCRHRRSHIHQHKPPWIHPFLPSSRCQMHTS
jgi:hypothetical protein